MSFVRKVSPEQAGPELRPLYDGIQKHYGFLPNYFQALGPVPHIIERERALANVLLGDGALPVALKEQIVLVVSGINSSSYCVAAHLELLRRLGIEKLLGRKLATDYRNAPVADKEMVLFRFSDKLTRNPSDIEKTDVDAVFKAGWDELALIETVLTVAWSNFVNRVAFGLGLFADF